MVVHGLFIGGWSSVYWGVMTHICRQKKPFPIKETTWNYIIHITTASHYRYTHLRSHLGYSSRALTRVMGHQSPWLFLGCVFLLLASKEKLVVYFTAKSRESFAPENGQADQTRRAGHVSPGGPGLGEASGYDGALLSFKMRYIWNMAGVQHKGTNNLVAQTKPSVRCPNKQCIQTAAGFPYLVLSLWTSVGSMAWAATPKTKAIYIYSQVESV